MDRIEAQKHIRTGAILAYVSASLTLLMMLVSLWTAAEGALGFFGSPAILIDVFILAALATSILIKHSRTAATLLVVYFIAAKASQVLETGSVTGMGLGLVFFYFFARAAQATFVWHKLEFRENPEYRPTKRWLRVTSLVAAVALVGVFVLGLYSSTDYGVPYDVVEGSQLSEFQVNELRDIGLIRDQDDITYFYGYDLSDMKAGGVLLAGNRLLIYFPDEKGQLISGAIFLDEIVSITKDVGGVPGLSQAYLVESFQEDRWIIMVLPWSTTMSKKFLDAIRENSPELEVFEV